MGPERWPLPYTNLKQDSQINHLPPQAVITEHHMQLYSQRKIWIHFANTAALSTKVLANMHRGGLNLQRSPITLGQALDRHVESKPWLVCTRGFEIYRHIRIAIRLCECVWKSKFLPPANFEKCNLQNAKCKMQNAKCKMQNAKCKMQNAKCKMQNEIAVF